MVVYKKGHKNSKGEAAPWTIVSHETGKILSSHTSKSAAEEHLRQMEYYKHAKSPKTEGVLKDIALAGALAVSPMANVDANAANIPQETVPVTNDYSKLQFNKNVRYVMTPDQYKKLADCHNLPVNFVVPKPGASPAKAAPKTAAATSPAAAPAPKADTTAATAPSDGSCGTMCHLGKAIGSGAKQVWNGVKSLGKGLYDGWNSKNEAVEEFNQWMDEQPKTPMMEAVKSMYNTLFEADGNWFRDRFNMIADGTDPDEIFQGAGSRSAYDNALNTHIWDIGMNVAHDIGTKTNEEVEQDIQNSPDKYSIVRAWMDSRDPKTVEQMLGYIPA